MCHPGSRHGFPGMGPFGHGRCGCGCGHPFRRFFTAKEEEAWLENYRDELKKELAGVEERLKERGKK